MAQHQGILQAGAPKVQIAVLEPEHVTGLDAVFDHEGRGGGLVQDHDRFGRQFDVAGGHLGVAHLGGAQVELALNGHAEFGTAVARGLVGLGLEFGVDDHLAQAAAVAQGQEDEAAQVAAALNPAHQGDLLAGDILVDAAAVVAAFQSDRFHIFSLAGASRSFRRAAMAVRATLSCSPLSRSLSMTVPASTSFSPRIRQ
ncbi:MAG: hypothetical protein BWY87_00388 [Deltaproteobacteria bacterium ADurb.Bin510]|nr:MAG: hypothetical protein BWY87_00388 [Deltaproteobacteria bacterium ADurb.Bin510]